MSFRIFVNRFADIKALTDQFSNSTQPPLFGDAPADWVVAWSNGDNV